METRPINHVINEDEASQSRDVQTDRWPLVSGLLYEVIRHCYVLQAKMGLVFLAYHSPQRRIDGWTTIGESTML